MTCKSHAHCAVRASAVIHSLRAAKLKITGNIVGVESRTRGCVEALLASCKDDGGPQIWLSHLIGRNLNPAPIQDIGGWTRRVL